MITNGADVQLKAGFRTLSIFIYDAKPTIATFIARKGQKIVIACKPTVVLFPLGFLKEKEPQNSELFFMVEMQIRVQTN